jgi:hypothetical protein
VPVAASSSVVTTSAAPPSLASRVSRAAVERVSGGAPSMMTKPNAPLRSSTSAHQAARPAERGRTIHTPLDSAVKRDQSRGASVRAASM